MPGFKHNRSEPGLLQWLCSLVFVVQMYVVMLAVGLFYVPLAIFNRSWAYSGIRTYSGWVRWSARHLVGLDSEIRGKVPTGKVLICAKHQSFFDIIMILSVVDCPRFVMKRQLLNVPIVGFYAKRIGCIAIDRSKGRLAVKQMLEDVGKGEFVDGQLVIYPQGTRVGPGKSMPYKIGASILYTNLEIDCVPAATNVGVFWPRLGILRRPGLAVVEFLEVIPPGLSQVEFQRQIEQTIETASNQLMRDAGFEAEPQSPPVDFPT